MEGKNLIYFLQKSCGECLRGGFCGGEVTCFDGDRGKVRDTRGWHGFYQHIEALHANEGEVRARGLNPRYLTQHYRDKLALTEMEYKEIRRIALLSNARVKLQDAKAEVAIDRYRRQIVSSRANNDATLPTVPDELKLLQQEKEAIIDTYVASLRTSFGGARFQQLDERVNLYLRPKLTWDQAKSLPPEVK